MDRFRGVFGGLVGSNFDEDEVWSQVRRDKDSLETLSESIDDKSDYFDSEEGDQDSTYEFKELDKVNDIISNASNYAGEISIGAQAAYDANEEPISEKREFEVISGIQEKIADYASNLSDTAHNLAVHAGEAYDQIRQVLNTDRGLEVDFNLPEFDWESTDEVIKSIDELNTLYSSKRRELKTRADFDQTERDPEDRAERIAERKEEYEDSDFQQFYDEIHSALNEQAENDVPQTALEKARQAHVLSEFAQDARNYMQELVSLYEDVSNAKESAYRVSDNLASILEHGDYAIDNPEGGKQI